MMIIPGDGAGDLINQRSPEISQSNLKNPFKNLLMKTHALLTEASFIQLNEQQVSEVALTLVAFGLGRRWRRVFSSFFAIVSGSLPRQSASVWCRREEVLPAEAARELIVKMYTCAASDVPILCMLRLMEPFPQ